MHKNPAGTKQQGRITCITQAASGAGSLCAVARRDRGTHALHRRVADTWMAESQWFFSDGLLVLQVVKTAVTLQFHATVFWQSAKVVQPFFVRTDSPPCS